MLDAVLNGLKASANTRSHLCCTDTNTCVQIRRFNPPARAKAIRVTGQVSSPGLRRTVFGRSVRRPACPSNAEPAAESLAWHATSPRIGAAEAAALHPGAHRPQPAAQRGTPAVIRTDNGLSAPSRPMRGDAHPVRGPARFRAVWLPL